ncbi:hypothetical protein Efla_007701 [Eimeria flavescens]
MRRVSRARRLLLAALAGHCCMMSRPDVFPSSFSPFLQHAEAADSFLDSSLGQGAHASPDLALLNPGTTPRRLSFSSAVINFATQVATSDEIRQLMAQWTKMMGEVFKGPDTSESNIPYYWKVPECVLTVDYMSVIDVGVADSAKVALAYTPVHNAIMLAYVEEAAEWIQVFKRPMPRVQFLHVPAECMVDENTTYTAFCMKPTGKCYMTRLDIHLTRITKQMMTTLTPIPAPQFIEQQMEEGFLYDDAVDMVEAPTAVGRLLFDPINCIMHTRVQAASADRVFVYHNPQDHSLRVDAQSADSSWFRRKVILPLGCGGTEEKDFTTVVHLLADGHFKVIIRALVARGTDYDREAHDNIEIKEGQDVRPKEELRFGEHDPKDIPLAASGGTHAAADFLCFQRTCRLAAESTETASKP